MTIEQTEVYQDYEIEGNYFVDNAATKQIAYDALIRDYPEAKEMYTAEDAEKVWMAKCLDCESYWVISDGTCGECGETQLSKRTKESWQFAK